MFSKLKQFKDLRDKAKTIQAALSQEHAEGSSNWGKVKIVVDGTQKVTSVTIDPSVVNPAEVEKLCEMIREATNDAMDKIQKHLASKMKDIGGLDLAKEMQDVLKQ